MGDSSSSNISIPCSSSSMGLMSFIKIKITRFLLRGRRLVANPTQELAVPRSEHRVITTVINNLNQQYKAV